MSLLERVRATATTVRETVGTRRLPTWGGPAPAPQARWRPTLVGAITVGITLLAAVVLATLGWGLAGGTSGNWRQVLGLGAALWFLGTGGGLTADGVTVSIVPIACWALAAWVSMRGIERAADDAEAPVLAVLPRFLLGYAGAVLATGLLTLLGPARPSWLGLLTCWSVPLLGALGAEWRDPQGRLTPLLPAWLDRAVRPAAWGLAALAGAALVAVLTLLVVRWPTVTGVYAALGTSPLDVVTLTLAQLLFLPDLLVWVVAVIAGPEVALSSAGTVSLSGSHPGLLPLVPVFGLVPPDAAYPGGVLWLSALPVAVGGLVGWRATLAWSRLASGRSRLLTTAAAVGLVALAGLGLGLLATGSAGSQRLAHLGPNPWLLGLVLLGELALGAGAWLGVDTGRHRTQLRAVSEVTGNNSGSVPHHPPIMRYPRLGGGALRRRAGP